MRLLLLIPQRYEFSSKSQHIDVLYKSLQVVADTTKVRIFKQITTLSPEVSVKYCCCWYHKGTNFQANHNMLARIILKPVVVADTTKVRIFKQITTIATGYLYFPLLLLIPQRYEFSSKSQRKLFEAVGPACCCWYHKGTNFQANHNTTILQYNVV